jgi:MFS family permease
MTDWHLLEEDLRGYASGHLDPPLLWSVEAHVLDCATCRERLSMAYETSGAAGHRDRGWRRLDVAIDDPAVGPVESLLIRCGVPESTARLLTATPLIRASWLVAVAVTLLVVAAITSLSTVWSAPLPFLVAAPLAPLAGVAVAFRRGLDPTHEIATVAPISMFRLVLLRVIAVLITSTVVTAVASLALPRFGAAALAWLAPAWALTTLCLYLLQRVGPAVAAGAVAAAWLIAVAITSSPSTGTSAMFSTSGQLTVVALGIGAIIAVIGSRRQFDVNRHLTPSATLRRRDFS